jgi:hypothetical protein
MSEQLPNAYELKVRILGNEVFAVAIGSSSDSNRWIALGLITIFSLMIVLGAYGDKLVALYQYLVG